MEKVYNKKRKELRSKGLVDIVFSWSIEDVLNKDLYKDQVKKIPETFLSTEQYRNSFLPSLIEETHSDLASSMESLYRAPFCEILSVKMSRNFRAPKNLFYYEIVVKRASDAENNDVGKYQPASGDLVAFTDVRPKCEDDLSQPGRSFHIAYVFRARDERITILSSNYLEMSSFTKQKQLHAVFLINMTTNVRIWNALHSKLKDGNIIEKVLRADSTDGENCSVCFSEEKKNHPLVSDTLRLIWGPPGTGKTKTAAVLLFSLLKLKCRTLTCAPTNTAVMQVTARLLGIVKESLEFGMYGLGDIVLFGNSARMKVDGYEGLRDVFLDDRIDKLLKCLSCMEA
ncbi:p-loop nucleoside triphosphate hydrolase superfamily protein [Quillaja saponaria]|uniref:P-loop nucleoside triphosphate hydrolase superfamily protein n=1 Tax=Quillaja saponaria TaxID=32244 RepID=A0AAD7LN30_QUISA|nr:p-loop nucleoside triphosphate hydrolase superfamily protein [Quillaja saponaria]